MRPTSVFLVAFLTVIIASAAHAQPLMAPRGDRFVPWTVLNPGVTPPRALLVLYWLPLSREEVRGSELVTSKELAEAAGDCVSLQVIRPDDYARVAKYKEKANLPIAVLTDGNGAELARVDSVKGLLPAGALASLIRDEMRSRSRAADEALASAKEKQDAGDVRGATALYSQVAVDGCVASRQSKLAAKTLKKLGGK